MSEYTLVSTIEVDENDPNRTFRVIKPGHLYVGFCGYLWQVIRAMFKYPNDQYYIYIGNPSGGPNVWDFYFKQPHVEVPPHPSLVKSEVGIIFDEESEFVDVYPCMKRLSDEERMARRRKFGEITKKYFVLKPEVQAKVDEFKQKHFDGKKVFGFHVRGTDHPDKKDISDSFPKLDAMLEKYDTMYASTDEAEIMRALQERYQGRMISYPSNTRSDSCDFQMPRTESSEHTHAFRYNALINWTRENSGYQIGEDIIVETYLMASTNFLLAACNSNVNYFVRAVNAELPYEIIYTPEL